MTVLCNDCPRQCNHPRTSSPGFCGTDFRYKVAKAHLHPFEEPMISGAGGSGTLFFSGCNLRCLHCQNHRISQGGVGRLLTEEELIDVMLRLEAQGADNINLVTPTHYAGPLAHTLRKAKARGLSLPIVYNSSGYESVDTLKHLQGLVDVYLPDLKFYKDSTAMAYAKAPHYFQTAVKALAEMFRQTGPFQLDSEGRMVRGMIIRHLCLPDMVLESKLILRHIRTTFGDDVYLSLMNQYTPMHEARTHPVLSRRVPAAQYASLVDYARQLGFTHGLLQDPQSQSAAFTPDFDGEGLPGEGPRDGAP